MEGCVSPITCSLGPVGKTALEIVQAEGGWFLTAVRMLGFGGFFGRWWPWDYRVSLETVTRLL